MRIRNLFKIVFISTLCYCPSLKAQVTDTLRPADSARQAEALAEPVPASTYAHTIKGVVVDKLTREPLPFVTVFFPYTPVGTATDEKGRFELAFDNIIRDTLQVQFIGYKTYRKKININTTTDLTIELEPDKSLLREVVIYAGEDPAILLLRKIIARKPYNDPNRVNSYSYEAYNKIELDVVNLTREQFEKLPIPYIKKFGFIYRNLDSISEKQPFLPFFLVETLSDYYFQKDPLKRKEYIKANEIRGINNESITQYMGKMNITLKPYDNYILFFDKQFVSPISNAGAVFYKYKIVDTQVADGHKVIRVKFRPQREGENCFTGMFSVVDSVYALQYLEAEMPKTANVNWIKDASFYQVYQPVDSTWFCTKENFTSKLTLTYDGIKLPELIGRKTTYYKDIRLNDPRISRIVNSSRFKEDIVVSDTARNKSDEFWAGSRHDTLTRNEKNIYYMFDSLEQDPTYKKFKHVLRFLFAGVWDAGPIEIGPYWNLYNNNRVEGNRFCFSLGTTPKLFKNVYINGYVAYGTKDEKFKYHAGVFWITKRHPRSYFFFSYLHDLTNGVHYYDKVTFDNLVNLAIRKPGIPIKRIFNNESRFEFYKDYYSGFGILVTALHRRFEPYAPLPSTTIFTDNLGHQVNTITSAEVDLRIRYAYKEKFLDGRYLRVSLGSKYPIVELHYARGIKGFLKSGYNYNRLSFAASDNIKVAPFGTLYLNIFAAKYFGKLPYLLLENHPGNENYFYNRYTFNLISNFEVLSDQYAGFNFEHSMGGGVFKYIPLVKKWHLRQFWTARGMIGSLSPANKALNLNKGYDFKTLQGNPYVEAGTGIENIFRVFRIDFIWRVLPKPRPAEPLSERFGIFGSIRINF